MRFFTAITGVVTSAVLLAGCDGGQVSTAPDETPTFAKISSQKQYTATLTCNAAAIRSYANVNFTGVLGTYLFCNPQLGNQVSVTAFDNFNWTILLFDVSGVYIKSCPKNWSTVKRTGKFVCNDVQSGLSAVLTIEPS